MPFGLTLKAASAGLLREEVERARPRSRRLLDHTNQSSACCRRDLVSRVVLTGNRRGRRRAGDSGDGRARPGWHAQVSTFGALRHRHVSVRHPTWSGCSRGPSRTRSSGSTHAASRSRRTSRAACPAFAIVGLADRACQEAKQRVRSGIASAELEWPLRRITVNLAPRGAAQGGLGFDLPIALSILAASGQIPRDRACRARGRRRARARRPAAAGRRRARARGGRAPGGPVADALRRALRARGGARGHRAGAPAAPRGGGRLPARRARPGALGAAGTAAAAGGRARSRRRARTGAGPARARDRRRRRHNLLLAGPARHGQDDARAPAAGDPAAALAREALEVTRIHSVAGTAGRRRPLVTTRAASARRTTAPRSQRSSAAGLGRRRARSASRTAVCSSSTSSPSSSGPRSRRCGSRSRTASSASRASAGGPSSRRASSSSRPMNLCPCGARGDPCGRLQVLAAAARRVPGQAVAGAARPVRPGRRDAAARASRARRPAGRGLRRRCADRVAAARERLDCERAAVDERGDELLDRAVERLPLSGRGRARARRVAETIAALAASRAVGAEHLAEALAYRSPTSSARRERALARGLRGRDGLHLVRAPRERAFREPSRAGSTSRVPGAAARAGRPLARAVGAAFPPLLRAIHDPPPGCSFAAPPSSEFSARRRSRSWARALLAYGAPCRAHARARAGRRGARRRERPRTRRRRRGAPRRARGGRDDGRRARLWDRPRLSGRARELARRIARPGLIVSEYAPGVEPAPWRFPARNRIIAGLSAATVVVEARDRSGALITADLALEEGREVSRCPGRSRRPSPQGRTICSNSEHPRSRRPRTCWRSSAHWRRNRTRRARPSAERARSAARRPGERRRAGACDRARCRHAGVCAHRARARRLRGRGG